MISYDEAREAWSPDVRQQYLTQMNLEVVEPYVTRAIYDPTDDVYLMATRATFRAMLGLRAERSDLLVFPNAFRLYDYEDGFKSVLLDHEGMHAREIFENPSQVIGTVRNLITSLLRPSSLRKIKRQAEIRAIQNQLKAHEQGRRNLQDSHIRVLEHELQHYLGCSSHKSKHLVRDD